MASRRSGRRNKGGNKLLMLFGAAVLIGAGAGGWMMFGGSKIDATQAATTLGLENLPILAKAEDKKVEPDQNAGALAQVNQLITECEGALKLADKPREDALRTSYDRVTKLLEGPLPLPERERAIGVFHLITSELFLSSVHNEFSENYSVKSGDSFDRIAQRAGISTNLLYMLNNKPRGSRSIHPGDNLKLPKGKLSVVVRKRDFTTSLYFGDKLVRQYIVAHGANDNTPEGTSTISSMAEHPEKSSRGPNDPVNEMRLRWIGLEPYADARFNTPEKKRTGIGFHGTQYPESIPGMTSRGCMRMKDADVIELYDILRIGNKVEIKS